MNGVSAKCLQELGSASVTSLLTSNLTLTKENDKLRKQIDKLTIIPKSASKSGSKSKQKSVKSINRSGGRLKH